jgi:hypothetical protein
MSVVLSKGGSQKFPAVTKSSGKAGRADGVESATLQRQLSSADKGFCGIRLRGEVQRCSASFRGE